MTFSTYEDCFNCGDVQPYNFQVAGHMYSLDKTENKNFLHCIKESILLKPFHKSKAEWRFYQSVFGGSEPHLISLRPLIPYYFGKTVIQMNGEETEYLKLEDIIDAYRFPSVMDVKMGCRTWTETSTSAKIQKEKLKFPHGEALGFRIFGMKVYNPDDDDYKIKDKYWGRQITPGTVLESMGTFFNHRNSYCTLRIIRLFIRRLQEIRNWFEHQRALAFYRSSILFVYNWSANQNAAPLADVRIIDFAHVVPTTDRDENYLEGLLNLIGYFRAYEKQLTETLHRQIQPI